MYASISAGGERVWRRAWKPARQASASLHGTVGALAGVLVAEPAAALDPAHEVRIRAGEGRRAQRPHQGHLVRGVVDGAQAGQQVAHLLSRQEQRAALEPVRDARVFQRPLQATEVRPRWQQDGEIAVPRRARMGVPAAVRHRSAANDP